MIEATTTSPERAWSEAELGWPAIRVEGTPEQRVNNQAALDALDRRFMEVAALTGAERVEAQAEWERCRDALNENRTSDRLRYAE